MLLDKQSRSHSKQDMLQDEQVRLQEEQDTVGCRPSRIVCRMTKK